MDCKISKVILKSLYQFIYFIYDLIFYRLKKKNSEHSYQFLIKLFCLFGGNILGFINFFLRYKKDNYINKYPINQNLNIDIPFGELDLLLKEKGYFLKEKALNDDTVNNLVTKLKLLKGKYISDHYKSLNEEILDLKAIKAVKFAYFKNDLINIREIQELALSKELLLIAQNYLGSLPILDIIECWWSFPPSGSSIKSDDTAAQMWHFDMDRTKWVKVFFYLTDCQINNGPHVFIEKSHKNNEIPFSIRKKGYSRVEDDLIFKNFPFERIKTITGKKGSLIAEDTRGLHKGQTVKEGSRLVLQFQYSSSLFGGQTNKVKIPSFKTELFQNLLKENSKILENFY